jgi:hypothetical protein
LIVQLLHRIDGFSFSSPDLERRHPEHLNGKTFAILGVVIDFAPLEFIVR